MNRLPVFIFSLLLPLTGAAQGVLLDDLTDQQVPEVPDLRRYSVEIIVFAYAEDVSVGTEVFTPELLPEPEVLLDENGLPLIGPLAEALDEAEDQSRIEEGVDPTEEASEEALTDEAGAEQQVTFEFELMAKEDYTLLDTLERLETLDAYEPLMHFGWVQGMLPDVETPELPLEDFATPPPGLRGALTLYLSRYLHLVVDIELAADRQSDGEIDDEFSDAFADESARDDDPVPTFTDRRLHSAWNDPFAPSEPRYAPLAYSISENRIVRNGELRYYDHPKFGVIARIARIEAEDEEPVDGSEAEATRVPSAFVE